MRRGNAGGRWARQAGVIAAGLAIGAGAVFVVRGGEPGPVRPAHPPSVTRFSFSDGPPPPVTVDGPDQSVARPTEEPATAESALGVFLRAAAEAKPEAAYPLLDSPSRRRYPSEAAWARAQADLARPVAFEIAASRAAFPSDGDVVEIEVTSTQRPSLDAFRGLVPGRSRSLWQVRREQGGWRVAAEPLSVRPILPPDAGAPDTVKGWVSRLQACDRNGAASLQVGTYLYGPAHFVQAPCEKQGPWTVGNAVGLDQAPDPSDLLAAFGPGVGSWTRLVPVDGPGSRFFVAVAPMGDAWQVVGVAVRS